MYLPVSLNTSTLRGPGTHETTGASLLKSKIPHPVLLVRVRRNSSRGRRTNVLVVLLPGRPVKHIERLPDTHSIDQE